MPLELRNRPLAYNNVDGVGELGIGLMCFGYALFGWLQLHTSNSSVWNSQSAALVFFVLVMSTIHYGSKAIKSRITYPRTGFVEYRKQDRRRWAILGFIVSMFVSAGLAAALKHHWSLTTPASFLGLVFAASYAHRIARTVPWKWAIVWIMTGASIVIAILPADTVGRIAGHSRITELFTTKAVGAFLLTFGLYGSLLLISGGITFWLYLRGTHRDP